MRNLLAVVSVLLAAPVHASDASLAHELDAGRTHEGDKSGSCGFTLDHGPVGELFINIMPKDRTVAVHDSRFTLGVAHGRNFDIMYLVSGKSGPCVNIGSDDKSQASIHVTDCRVYEGWFCGKI